jgi:hypothetical protein
MKKLIYLLLFVVALYSCDKEEIKFEPNGCHPGVHPEPPKGGKFYKEVTSGNSVIYYYDWHTGVLVYKYEYVGKIDECWKETVLIDWKPVQTRFRHRR